MNYQETERLLGAIMQVDDRITVDKFRVAAWQEILDEDITYDFAIKVVKDHYGAETKAMMPAHVNQAWRSIRKAEREREKTRALSGSVRVDRSPEVELEIEELKRKLLNVGTKTQPYKAQGQTDRRDPRTSASGVFASTW